MSLEQAIKENTDALLKVLDATNRLADLRADAIETVKKAAAPAPKADPKPKAEPKAEPKPEAKAEAPTGPLPEKITEYVTNFDQSHEQATEERAARAARVKAIYAALSKQTGVTVATQADVPEKYIPVVIKKLDELIAAGNLVIGVGDEDEGLEL